jgi:hypothetical protein
MDTTLSPRSLRAPDEPDGPIRLALKEVRADDC